MDQILESRKRSVRHPKDWERRARVVAALSAKRMTVDELARRIDRSAAYLSAIIWGVDRSRSTEDLIAKALGTTHDALFASGPGRAGRAA